MEVMIGFLIAVAIAMTGVGAGTVTAPTLILFLGMPLPMAVGTALIFGAVVKIVAAPVYWLRSFTMSNRSGTHVEPGGRFRLQEPSLKDLGAWSWKQNPFVGTRPLQGLLVILLLFNSTDLHSENNTIYQIKQQGHSEHWYVVRDLGAALGETAPAWAGGRNASSMKRVMRSAVARSSTRHRLATTHRAPAARMAAGKPSGSAVGSAASTSAVSQAVMMNKRIAARSAEKRSARVMLGTLPPRASAVNIPEWVQYCAE